MAQKSRTNQADPKIVVHMQEFSSLVAHTLVRSFDCCWLSHLLVCLLRACSIAAGQVGLERRAFHDQQSGCLNPCKMSNSAVFSDSIYRSNISSLCIWLFTDCAFGYCVLVIVYLVIVHLVIVHLFLLPDWWDICPNKRSLELSCDKLRLRPVSK